MVAPRRDELPLELARLVKLLVDEPEHVALTEARDADGSTSFRVQVGSDDLGKVIGRQGRIARALRSLLAERAARDGERYELEILED